MTKSGILLLLFFFAGCNCVFSQTDSIPDFISKPDSLLNKDITAFFVVDKIWGDKNSAYKRPVAGNVNFLQILDGKIYLMTRSYKNSIGYCGTLDSLDITEDESGNSLMFYSHQYNVKTITRFHNLEITQHKDYSIVVHWYCRPTLDGYFFSAHPASDPEISEMKKYFTTKPWRFY